MGAISGRKALLLWLLLALGATPALADSRSFDVDHLQLAVGRSSFVATEGAGEVTKWDARAAVVYRFIQSPLVVEHNGVREEVIVDRSIVEVQGAVQFHRYAGLGVSLPIVVSDRGDLDGQRGAAIGDLRLVPRVELVHRGRFGLAALLGLRVPTGARDRFIGEGMAVFEPRLAFQVHLGMFDLGTNVGVRVREQRSYLDLSIGNEVFMTLAAAVTPRPFISAVVELHGDTAMSAHFASRAASPLEILGGVFGTWRGLRGGVSAGFGLAEGFGAPRARVLVSVEYRRWDRPAVPTMLARRPLPPPPRPVLPPVAVVAAVAAVGEVAAVAETTPDAPDVIVHVGRIELARPIFFATNRRRVQHSYFDEISELARVLEARPVLRTIWIEGHADATGPEAWNLELSRRRAEAVADKLIAAGVAAERLRPVGFGEARPMVPTPRGEPNERNRRVHFYTDSETPPPIAAGLESTERTP